MHEIIKRLKVFFAVLVRLFSRLLCWRRNRRNSGSLLPITVVTTGGGNSSSALVQPQNAQYMYSTSSIVHSYTNNVNNTWNLVNKHPTSQPEQDKTDTEPDYFQDIQPTIKRQKKLLIRSEEECKLSERLNFNSAYIQTNPDSMKDATEDDAVVGNGWEEETGVDDLNVDQSLRNIRAAERERRLAEHRRIKLEKEQQRKAKTKQFMATKIS